MNKLKLPYILMLILTILFIIIEMCSIVLNYSYEKDKKVIGLVVLAAKYIEKDGIIKI